MLNPRQRIRRMTGLIAFLLFPVLLNYYSPMLVMMGAWEGILTGSGLTFISLVLVSLCFGRLFCSWLCPAGALQDLAMPIRPKPINLKLSLIKYGIWLLWFGAIVAGFVRAGGVQKLFFTYPGGQFASNSSIEGFLIYLSVVGLILVLALSLGKRGFCHTACWISPFMVIGSSLGKFLRLPQMQLRSTRNACISCGACTKACPMSLPVQTMVETHTFSNRECILCASCSDACPKKVLKVSFYR